MVATHASLVGSAIARLTALPFKIIVVTDSLPIPKHESLQLHVASLTPMTIAEAAARSNVGESMAGLLTHR